jgi:hypothetical protein
MSVKKKNKKADIVANKSTSRFDVVHPKIVVHYGAPKYKPIKSKLSYEDVHPLIVVYRRNEAAKEAARAKRNAGKKKEK